MADATLKKQDTAFKVGDIVIGMMGKTLSKHAHRSADDMVWSSRVHAILPMSDYKEKFSNRPDAIYTVNLQQKENVWHDATNVASDLSGKNVLFLDDVHRFTAQPTTGLPILNICGSLTRATRQCPATKNSLTVYNQVVLTDDQSIYTESIAFGSTDPKRVQRA